MLMHAIAHGSFTDTVRVLLEADSGRKIPCRTGDSNPRQYCAWLLSRTLYQLSCFHLCSFSLMHGNSVPKTEDIELPFKNCTVDMPCIYTSVFGMFGRSVSIQQTLCSLKVSAVGSDTHMMFASGRLELISVVLNSPYVRIATNASCTCACALSLFPPFPCEENNCEPKCR